MDANETIEEMTNSIEGLKSKVDKAEVGKSFIENYGSADFIEALTNWFQTGVAEDTEMYFESVGRRVLWLYPNGLTLTIGAEINLTISSATEQLSEASELPPICEPDNWEFFDHANGWSSNQRYDKETILEIIQALEELYGKPRLIIPWENRAENTSDQDEEEFVSMDSEEGTSDPYLDFYRLMKLVQDEDIHYFSEWESSVVFEEDYMSPYSHFEKYENFTDKLRESKLVILDLEEHCAACSNGVEEAAIKEDPELEGKPTFTTWSQNSTGMVRPDGAINIDAYCSADTDTMQKIKALADQEGVPCEIGEDVLYFVSPKWSPNSTSGNLDIQFKALIDDGQIEKAIELLVPIAERPDLHQSTSCSAINTIVFTALIPEQRFVESIAWLDDSIHGDYGYESWNSISNLGHVYLRLGEVEKATQLFTTLLQAQFGPLDEATEFLEIIKSGKAETLISKNPLPRESESYKELYAELKSAGDPQNLLEAFALSRGGATHGFVQGVLSSTSHFTHDAIAQALWDFVTEQPSFSLPTYLESAEAVIGGTATKDHARVIRENALLGTAGAASLMFNYSQQNQKYADPWKNVAAARGLQ
mgnify:CR=1 FL=1